MAISNEMIAFALSNQKAVEERITFTRAYITATTELLEDAKERLSEDERLARVAIRCVMYDGIAVEVENDGWDVATVVPNAEGSTFRASIYKKCNAEGYAVMINEVNHNKWFSPPFRWNGGKVIGLGKEWTEEEAKQHALDWVLNQSAEGAI